MDQEKIKSQIERWMIDFVEVNNPALGNWPPCPYAKAARLSGMIDIQFCTIPEMRDAVRQSMATLEIKEVVVICFDHTAIDAAGLQDNVAKMNNELMPLNYVILEDHPDALEFVNDVNMNFGHCGLLVVQKLDKLNNAADKLRSQGYYKTWDQKALDEVVTWRYEK